MNGVGIVDSHYHLQALGLRHYPWLEQARRDDGLEGDLTPIVRDYLPDDHARAMKHLDIDFGIHIENGWTRDDPVGETRWLAGLPDGPGKPRAIIAYADLSDPDVGALLDAHLEKGPVKGVRQILNRHHDPRLSTIRGEELMTDPAWRRGFSALAERDLSFDLQIYPSQLDDASGLARSFPELHIILDHIGMPIDRGADALAQWRSGMMKLAQAGNVWVKLSGGFLGQDVTEVSQALHLYQTVLGIFPSDRVMLGSNLPVDTLYGGAKTIAIVWRELLSNMSERDAQKLRRENAITAYRIAA